MKAYLLETEYTQPTHAEKTCDWLTEEELQVHLMMAQTTKAL